MAMDMSRYKQAVRLVHEALSYLDDIYDALDTTPPHPDVAKERAEILRQRIRDYINNPPDRLTIS